MPPDRQIQKYMGHNSLVTTTIYLHVTTVGEEVGVAKINALMSGRQMSDPQSSNSPVTDPPVTDPPVAGSQGSGSQAGDPQFSDQVRSGQQVRDHA